MNWQIADPAHLLAAIRISLAQGGQYLKSRLAPNGPILAERNLSYIHKTSWGMHAAGIDHGTIARLTVYFITGAGSRPLRVMMNI